MKLAFCLFNYFPYGGLQRDFLRIATLCAKRGHEIHVFTMRLEGMLPSNFHVHLIDAKGWQNHTKARSFAKKVKRLLDQEHYDLVIGFNKMPYLDWYYAADVCYKARIIEERGKLYTFLPRFHEWGELEKAVFADDVKTKIMLIAEKQKAEYQKYYHTEEARFYLLPPGIDRDRLAKPDKETLRKSLRLQFNLTEDDILLLMVGSGFKTKGVDRSIRALASLPPETRKRCQLWIIGKDEAALYIALAKKLNVELQVKFLGAKDDVPNYLLAADLLLHPSYHENTGTVLLEALASALPVLTVAACGYAFYIELARAGRVLPEPFKQSDWNVWLAELIADPNLKTYGENGYQFAKVADIYSMPERACDLIENSRHEP